MTDTPIDELEAEWSELRGGERWLFGATAGDERPSLWFFPVMLLYTGLFFGPFATALAAVFTMRLRIGMREAAIVLGACGAAWCLLQGLSVYNGAWWTEIELQTMRSGTNFAAGIAAYLVIRPVAMEQYRQTMRTLIVSIGVIVLACLVFLVLPPTFLIALGR